MLECNKNYATIALNCTLNNSNRMISASEIDRRCRNNNIENDQTHKTLKRAFMNMKE